MPEATPRTVLDSRGRRNRARPTRVVNGETRYQCTGPACLKWLPRSCFYPLNRPKGSRDGLYSRCKLCHCARVRERQVANHSHSQGNV